MAAISVSVMGKGRLMGTICYTWIPFILVRTNQSHLLLLSDPYSANPQVDPKTHNGTDTVVLFPLSWFSQPTMLMNLYSMFRSYLSSSHHITPSICDYGVSAYFQPHSGSAAYTFFIVICF